MITISNTVSLDKNEIAFEAIRAQDLDGDSSAF